jgi:cell division protein FtsQ
LGKINKTKNAQLCRVIYDDDFLKKNIIAIQIMPNGDLKCSIELQLQIEFGSLVDVSQI